MKRPPAERQSARERLTVNGAQRRSARSAAPAAALAADPARAGRREYREWAYLGLLGFTAVLFIRPQDTLRPLEFLHLAELFGVLAVLALFFDRMGRREAPLKLNTDVFGVFAFGVVIAATIPFSFWPGGSFAVLSDAYVKIFVVFTLLVSTLTSAARVAEISGLITGACGYLSVRAVIDYARGVNLVEGGRVGGAVGGIFSNPNDLALNLVVFLPFALFCALESRTLARRIASAGCILAMLAAIVFTKSRGGFLGLAVTVIVLVALNRRRINPAAGVALFVGVLLTAPLLPSSFWERISSITDESRDATRSRQARWVLLREGYEVFLEHPLTGLGAGQFKNYNPYGRKERWRESHNVVTQVAAELGIFGLTAFMFLVWRAWAAALRARVLLKPGRARPPRPWISAPQELARPPDADLERDRRSIYVHAGALLASCAGWVVCSQFAPVAYNWTFYYLLAFGVADRTLAGSFVRRAASDARGRASAPRRARGAGAVGAGRPQPVHG